MIDEMQKEIEESGYIIERPKATRIHQESEVTWDDQDLEEIAEDTLEMILDEMTKPTPVVKTVSRSECLDRLYKRRLKEVMGR